MSDNNKTETHKRRENNRTSGKARAKKLAKRVAAEARKVERDKKTNAQHITELDMLFGKGLGAVKERARLNNPMPKKETKTEVVVGDKK